ncbi:restriction endonuclease [Dyella ginsengisoli]|uniref:restriction endonuclease n=1 Tax=Dyella ginsengisoli TaxID=363848 RepID=UPI0009FEFA36
MNAILNPTSIRWTTWWSRFLNRFRLRGRRRHLHKVARSRSLRQKIADIAGQENGFARALGYLRRIDPLAFEELILTAVEDDNVRIQRNLRYTGDGGIDGELTHRGQRVLIQAKRYSAHIQRAHVAAFASLCATHGALGLFVHTGRTGEGSRGAIADAGGRVLIVSGHRLIEFLTQPGCTREHLEQLICGHRRTSC